MSKSSCLLIEHYGSVIYGWSILRSPRSRQFVRRLHDLTDSKHKRKQRETNDATKHVHEEIPYFVHRLGYAKLVRSCLCQILTFVPSFGTSKPSPFHLPNTIQTTCQTWHRRPSFYSICDSDAEKTVLDLFRGMRVVN